MTIAPKYSFDDAPQPNLIVIPAMRRSDASDDWLRKASAGTDATMSICTGAFHLGRLGLLDGLMATTHHDSYDRFENSFPRVKLVRGRRFVDNGKFLTAGGLTSGIDLSLHVVSRYFGEDTATQVAAYMEHDSTGWRTGVRAAHLA